MTRAIQLNEGEEIVTIVRRHWFPLILEAAVDLFVFAGLFAALGAFDVMLYDMVGGFNPQRSFALTLYILAFVGVLLWMRFFAVWTDHWLDAWIVTNKRIIDIEQKGFFRREVSSFPLNRIQDVTYDVSGILATWLHFGDLRIQTASLNENLVMRQIPFPQDVKEQLMTALDTTKNSV